MGQTPRFGFNTFGGAQGGQISDNGQKYSTEDRYAMDSLHAAFENHNHAGGAQISDPTQAPTLQLSGASGQLPADVTVFYKISFVDAFGLETAASVETSVTIPPALGSPPAPSLTPQASGSLPQGNYYYALTYTQGASESAASQTNVATLLTPLGQTLITFLAPPPSADGVNVYRKGPNDADLYKLGHVTGAASGTFLDDGTVTILTGVSTPFVDTTNGTNSVAVTVGTADQPLVQSSSTSAWRIYRAYQSGGYNGTDLVHLVVETVNQVQPYGPLVITFVDSGESLMGGTPLSVSQALNPPPQAVISSGTVLPTNGANEPNGHLFVLLGGAEPVLFSTVNGVYVPVGTTNPVDPLEGVLLFGAI